MMIKERSWSSSSYRFGFQGQEGDDEVSGEGNSYTAEYWQYDSRLLRRWNTDPIVKPFESPYACFRNNPILLIDPTGEDVDLGKLSKEDRAEVKNKVNPEHEDYNEAYASLYQKLVDDHNTMYKFNNTHTRTEGFKGGNEGSVTYGEQNDAKQDIVNINYTTDVQFGGPMSVLFEETMHADQFRRGEWGFAKVEKYKNGELVGTKWGGVGRDIYDEVEAKKFANSNIKVKYQQNIMENRKAKKGDEKFKDYLLSKKPYSSVYAKPQNLVEAISRQRGLTTETIMNSWFDADGVLTGNDSYVGRKPNAK
jgi:RHS repeat-associated protein